MKGYCVKCKKMREMVKEKKVKLANGREAVKGKCGKCGTKMFVFTKKCKC